MKNDCLFCAIIDGELHSKKVYEDGSYTVYVFDSTEDLMDCAVARK